jgi:hypothetical protein
MQFKKIFEVAEVCIALYTPPPTHFSIAQKRFGKDPGALHYNHALAGQVRRI